MKTVCVLVVTVIICGLIPNIQSACSLTDCGVSITCSDYATFKSCLEGQLAGCGDSDGASKFAIEAQLKAKSVQCGAASASISMVTLVLAAAAAYLKS